MQENIFQQALRLLYERRLEQLGLTAAVTVTERKEREEWLGTGWRSGFSPQGQGRVDKSDRWFPKIGGNACKKDEREG